MRRKLVWRIVLAMTANTLAFSWPCVNWQSVVLGGENQPAIEGSSDEPREPPAKKAAVPSEAAQKKAAALVRDVYSEEYQQARTAAQKAKLARKLIEDAAKETEPSGQYVILRIARDLAAGAGDGQAAFQAIDELDRGFAVDALQMKAAVLQQSSTLTSRPPDAYKNLVEALLPLLDEAIRQDRFELADGLVSTAKAAVVKARDANLRKNVASAAERVAQACASYEKVSEALDRLKEKPTDPKANCLVGKYCCFNKLDWEKGLPMLARGSDAVLKELATLDLDHPKESEAQATIGDAWWDLAEKAEANDKLAAQQRAKYWYEQAVPGLSGLVKARVEKRMRLVGETDGVSPSMRPLLAVAPFDEKTAKMHQARWAKFLGVPVVQTNSIRMKLALIPPGEFKMGSPKELIEEELRRIVDDGWYKERLPGEGPQHRVRITRPYWLGTTDVTQEEYQRVMGSNPSHFPGDPKRPIEEVSWDEAMEFAEGCRICPGKRRPSDGTGCRRRRSGNMRAGRGVRSDIASGTRNRRWPNMRGTTRTPVLRHTLWGRSGPTPGGCTICMVTSGSGARTGTTRITMRVRPRTIRRGLQRAPTACPAAAVGTALGFAGQLTASVVRPTAGVGAAWASGSQ